jgi:hypothetical protein
MNHLDEWVHLIAKQLKSEAELIGVQAKSELYEDAARNTFVRMVLDPFLPSSYTVGSGKVIDAAGNISLPQDIVIYRSDYPQFNMPGSHDVFIYESVLATIQVRSKLVRKSFFSAMDQCASLGSLTPAIDLATRRAIAEKMKMQTDAQHQYIHPDPLHTGRFNLIARPHCFIYAFTGYQTSEHQLAENLTKWIDYYHQDHAALQLKSLPSVIATQGCFAWRNTAPFTIKQRALMGVGNDPAPLRLIILQLMHALNRRLQNTSDGYGIKSTIAPYLAHFEAPKISEMVGSALNPGDKKPAPINKPVAEQFAVKDKPPTVAKRPPETKAPIAEPVASAAHVASTNTAQPAQPAEKSHLPTSPASSHSSSTIAQEGNTSTSTPMTTDVEKPVQAAKQPATTDSKSNASKPQIKDISALRSRISAASTTNQPQEPSPIPKSTNPLSLFNTETEKEEVEEYKFDPIDDLKSEPETVEKKAEEPDDALQATQLIDNSQSGHDHHNGKADFTKTQKLPDKLTSQKKDGDTKDPLMDTMIEAPGTMEKTKSSSPEKKSAYVTETLI